jgi:hypothetical protein
MGFFPRISKQLDYFKDSGGGGGPFLPLAGGTMSGNLDMGGNDISNAGTIGASFLNINTLGNTSATSGILIHNVDSALIFNCRDDGSFVFYGAIYEGSGPNKRWDLANNLIYANDGVSDRIDVQNGALYYGGPISLDWKNKIFKGDWQLEDAGSLILGTTTGSKIGTSTSQKIGLWNATPVIQQTTGSAAATFITNTSLIFDDTATFDGYTIGQVVKILRTIGILA